MKMNIEKPIFTIDEKDFAAQCFYTAASAMYQCAKQACEHGNPMIVAALMREHDAMMIKARKVEQLLDI
jgi:hypothetical protein